MNRYVIGGCLVAGIFLAIGWHWREKPAAPPSLLSEPLVMSIEKKLNTIIIPDYLTSDVTIEEAVEDLRVKSRKFDPSAADSGIKGVNIVIIAGGDLKLPASPGLSLRGVPLAEALRHITSLVGLKYTAERHAVTIREQNDPQIPVYQKTTSLHHHMEKRILPTVQFQDASIEEVAECLRVNRGCLDEFVSQDQRTAPPLNYVLHLRKDVKRPPISIELRDIPLSEALRYCAEIANVRLRYDPFAVMITDREDGASAVIPLSSLHLPTVDFEGATLAESLEFIRIKSRELSPDHGEVSIVVKPGSGSPPIFLYLVNIPFSEALRYIAELSDHTLSYDGGSYVLTPVGVK